MVTVKRVGHCKYEVHFNEKCTPFSDFNSAVNEAIRICNKKGLTTDKVHFVNL